MATEYDLGSVLGPKGDPGTTAYQYAQQAGYTGTVEEFGELLKKAASEGVVTLPELTTALTSKIDTVPTAPAGNVPVFDDNGQIADSGRSASSIGDGNVKSINSQTPDDAGNVSVNTLVVGDTEPTDPNVVEWIDTSDDAEIKALEEIGAVVQVSNPVAGNVAVLNDKGGIADGGAALSDIVGGLQDVNMQLGRKANSFVRKIESGENLDDFYNSGNYYITGANAASVVNVPDTSALVLYVLRADDVDAVRRTTQIALGTGITSKTIWVRKHNDLGWGLWQRLAISEPPQEYDLPLSNGWTHINDAHGLKYGLCGDGKVQIMGVVTVPSGVASDQQIGTFPKGFCPAGRQVWIIAVDYRSALSYNFYIQADGAVKVWFPAPPAGTTLAFPVQTFYAG